MIAALILTVALGQPPGFLQVERGRWHDVDTHVDALVRLPYGNLIEGDIRDESFDGWEVGFRTGTKVTEEEKAKGRKALNDLQVLGVNKTLYLEPSKGGRRDSFGRLLGKFWYIGGDGKPINVGEWAKQNGHTRKGGK